MGAIRTIHGLKGSTLKGVEGDAFRRYGKHFVSKREDFKALVASDCPEEIVRLNGYEQIEDKNLWIGVKTGQEVLLFIKKPQL